MNRCSICANHLSEIDRCKFCSFEWDERYDPCKSDDWDILDLKDEDGWTHHQIRDRLFAKGIECLFVDIWSDDDVAWVVGTTNSSRLADALNIHEEVVYCDYDHGFAIINLFKEKYLRGMLSDKG